jgi:hypothetical protein
MSTLVQTLANSLDDRALQQISTSLGADQGQTQRAISAALPMLIGALGRNASTAEGAQSLTAALKRDHDGSILDNLTGALARPETLQNGMAILGHVLGGKQDAVQSGISQVSGLDKNTTGQLLTMLAPVLLGALGQMQQKEDLQPGQVATLLQTEREQTESNLGGLAQLLDMDGDGSIADDVMTLGASLLQGFFGRRK